MKVINLLINIKDKKLLGVALNENIYSFSDYANELKIELKDLELCLENLQRLNLIDLTQKILVPKTPKLGDIDVQKIYVNEMPEISKTRKTELKVEVKTGLAPSLPHFTQFGLAFIKACVDDAGNSNTEPSE